MLENVPCRLERLPELAYNLFWTWQVETRELFRRLDPELWEATQHNPVRLLRETPNLGAAAEDAGFVEAYHRSLRDLDGYLGRRDTWMARTYPDFPGPVAYFSAEFGVHESLPVYSGGLGILAGDHLKSASDLGVPLVGVGILYAQGYFRQRLDAEGRQQEAYENLEPESRPVVPALDAEGREVLVSVELPGREVFLKVWKAEVGRVSVLFLDADIPENAPEDRALTARLYGGDLRTRIVQELVLGVGGVRALRGVGIYPASYHMNEGHAAFSVLERMRELVASGSSFEDAREEVTRHTIFTTHTPVPAGHDAFPPDLFREFTAGWPAALGTDEEALWSLGHHEENWGPAFNMTVLAMNLSAARNAVSKLHREVSLDMWGYLFPGEEEPITYVTNGVHTWSWIAPQMATLLDRHGGGKAWREEIERPATWSFVDEIPQGELWETHRATKRGMAEFVNHRLRGKAGSGALDPDVLTIGFARRFATYKRATLLLTDPERLRRIAKDPDRPVRFLFAGKAHPADEPAKEFIRALYRASAEDFAGHLVMLEDYDMDVARRLVQGVDLWLNNPRRPLEASGTSGQKASLNGAPNFSALDGWWPEAYNGRNGWTIGHEREYASLEEQDTEDAESLYTTLESSIVPLYYDRSASGVPEGWVAMMKEAIKTVAPTFSTQRMVQDYVRELYLPHATRPETRQ
jgi:glycogen phosphorylase